jgi:hypothetical protein
MPCQNKGNGWPLELSSISIVNVEKFDDDRRRVACCCLKIAVLFLWGALSNERTGLQFAVQSLTKGQLTFILK